MPLDFNLSEKRAFIPLSELQTSYRAFIVFQRSCFVETWQDLSSARKNNVISYKPLFFFAEFYNPQTHHRTLCNRNSLQAPSLALTQALSFAASQSQAALLINITSTRVMREAKCYYGHVVVNTPGTWEPWQNLLFSCCFGWCPRHTGSQLSPSLASPGGGLPGTLQCDCFQLGFGEPLAGSWVPSSPGQTLFYSAVTRLLNISNMCE